MVIVELLLIDLLKMLCDMIDVIMYDSIGGVMEFIVEGIYEIGEVKGIVYYLLNLIFDIVVLLVVMIGVK